MDFTNKIDDELCKNIIENRNILLSSNVETPCANLDIDFFPMFDVESEINFVEPNFCSSQPSTPPDSQEFNITDQSGLKDEVIDTDLFEFLRSEDPDVLSLLESLNNSDFQQPAYLPQISINTTNQILNEEIVHTTPNPNIANETEKPQLRKFSLDDTCFKQEVESPPAQEPQSDLTPSRVSLRLINRRGDGNLRLYKKNQDMVVATRSKVKKEPKRLGNSAKRKTSIDDERDSLFSNENSNDNNTYKSVDNSVGYESDEHIYFDDDDFTPNLCENSNEREFQEFVFNYNQNNIRANKSLDQADPTKKDANKEAATRYRLKKLSEKDQIFETRMMLEKENEEVKRRCELVTTEINYLKNLLVQTMLTKGMIGDKLVL